MRRTLYAVLAVALIAGIALTGHAALTLDYQITVSVAADAISLTGITTTTDFGNVGVGTTIYSNQAQGQPRSTFENIGYARVDYQLTGASSNWTLGSTPGADTCVLSAIFTAAVTFTDDNAAGQDLVAALFSADDRVTTALQTATATVFATDAWSNTLLVKGYDVVSGLVNSSRSVRYQLQTPTSVTTSTNTFTITVSAVVG